MYISMDPLRNNRRVAARRIVPWSWACVVCVMPWKSIPVSRQSGILLYPKPVIWAYCCRCPSRRCRRCRWRRRREKNQPNLEAYYRKRTRSSNCSSSCSSNCNYCRDSHFIEHFYQFLIYYRNFICNIQNIYFEIDNFGIKIEEILLLLRLGFLLKEGCRNNLGVDPLSEWVIH